MVYLGLKILEKCSLPAGLWGLELGYYLFTEDYNRYELRDQEMVHTTKTNIVTNRIHNRRFSCV